MKKLYLLQLALFVFFTAFSQQKNIPVQLKNGPFRGENLLKQQNGPIQLPGAARYHDKAYALIQFRTLPAKSVITELRAQGISLAGYVNGNAYLAEMPANTDVSALKRYSAIGIYELQARDKISQRVADDVTAINSSQDDHIAITFFGSIDKNTVTAELQKAGASVVFTKLQPSNTVFIRAPKSALEKIAALPFVSYISKQRVKDTPLNYDNRALHTVNVIAMPTERNLQGRNVTIGVGDNADPSSHLDFTGRLIVRNPSIFDFHGTHTTGTTGGGGLLNPKYKGMAPKSTLVSQFFSDILVNTPTYINDFQMALTNNSYTSSAAGCAGNGEYDVLSYYADQQLETYPFLSHVFAAGNDGNTTCAPYSTSFATVKSGFQCAKNVLTVGAFDNWLYTIANFSSRGPAGDGRLKPEIVAGGTAIYSTFPNNNYAANWGTSMATPTVTGTLGLLYERYRQLHSGSNPSAALIKALACNGADDVGNPGPDYTYGFGVLNARTAVEAMENNHYFTNSVTGGGSNTHTISSVPAGAHQLKIMLYWADVPGAPYALSALVNNLDLTVTAPGGTTHYPLILNPAPASVNSNAVEGVDNTNNIEQVVIDNPPAGNYTITVNGTSIPSGSQEYYVAYELIDPGVTVEYPYGLETWVPFETETIRWRAYGSNSNSFTVEFSSDSGATWSVLDNNVAATSRSYLWTNVPAIATTTALVRVTRNGAGYADTSKYVFAILEQPTLTATNPCQGYAQLSWNSVTSATSYEIMMLQGDSMATIGSTASTSYLLGSLNKDSTYWFSVRPVSNGVVGRRAIAKTVVPNAGACSLPAFDNDFVVHAKLAPATGRMFTSTQLGNAAIQVRIKNLGNVAGSPFTASYQVNGGAVVTENVAISIAAHGSLDYTFTTLYNFSATGTYSIKTWVTHPGDPQPSNDTLVTEIKQLQNDPLVLSPNYLEGFESATAQTYIVNTIGITGLDRADFKTNNSNGRGRTFVNTGFERTGARCFTLDESHNSGASSTDSLLLTFNLSNYTPTDQVWLDFYFKNHGVDFSVPNNKVWIRGNDQAAWIPVFTLPIISADFGVYKAPQSINITEVLAAALPTQTISSSFQVKFGEQGFTSANSVITDGNVDDGYSFDDVTITNALNDVGVKSLVAPSLTGNCSLSNAEPITVQVKNYAGSAANNVAVSYDINGTTVTENIPVINAGQTLNYTFTQTADLSAFQTYNIGIWVNYGPDNYRNNDSLLNIILNTTPLITSYPYLQDFESNNGYWYSGGINNTWQWGVPAKAVIDKAASGVKAWVTDTLGTYNNSELSYLYSPCFNLSGMTQPVFSFSHIFRIEDNCNCDFTWVEYSLDDITWTKLGTVGSGTNWYNYAPFQVWKTSDTKWRVASYDVPTTASKVRFRVVMQSDPGVTYDGVGVDDVHVFDKQAIYSGPNLNPGITQPVNGSGWTDFVSSGKRVASINPRGQNLGNTTVKAFINTGPVRSTYSQYYLDRNLVIQPTTAPTDTVLVRFYFLDTEVRNLITATGCGICTSIPDAYEAGVTQYSSIISEEDSTLDNNISGMRKFHLPRTGVRVVPYDNGYYAEYAVTNFSEFWINGGGNAQNTALPVLLEKFTATRVEETGVLEWTTSNEVNTSAFVIEKSFDGNHFAAIGSLPANPGSVSRNYRFIDPHLAGGFNYYRLRIKDRDGLATLSPVRVIQFAGNDFVLRVQPNPVVENFVEVSTSSKCNRIELCDVSGRVLKSMTATGLQNTMYLRGIAGGVYFLNVLTGAGRKTVKIIVD